MATRTFRAARRAVPAAVALAVAAAVTGCTAATTGTVATGTGATAGTEATASAGQSARQSAGQSAGPAAAPSCTPAQLTLTYRGGGAGAGNDTGTIVFRDTSGQACALTGTVSATGLGAKGTRDTATIKAAIAGPGLLSPHAAPVPDGALPRAGELVYGWPLMAEYRDGPASVDNGICQPDWVIPASWRVTLPGGAAVVVPNKDPGDPRPLAAASEGGLITCLGQLDTPERPAYLGS